MMPGYILLLTSLVLTMTSAVTAVYENENNRVTWLVKLSVVIIMYGHLVSLAMKRTGDYSYIASACMHGIDSACHERTAVNYL